MKFQGLTGGVTAVLIFFLNPSSFAATMTVGRSPILTATLSGGTTYEVESGNGAGGWTPTGVLIAGSGLPTTFRLDGHSAHNPYRLSRIGGASFVTPTVAAGLHLSGSFPGAAEVRIEASPNLTANGWTHRGFAFPDASGSFVSALRPPFQFREFFRGLKPATPLVLASLASYEVNLASTYSGFGLVLDDMPAIYRDGFICAPCPGFYHRGGQNAAAVGECYEFTGPNGSTTVMVGDIGDTSPGGICATNPAFLDLSKPAFTALFPGAAGYGTATYRLVPAPVTGNVKLVTVINSGGFYVELRPYNHRAGIDKLEIRRAGSWLELSRTAYNSFVFNGSPALAFPLDVRVTSRFGEVVTFPPLPAINANDRFTASAQFGLFPDQGPAPVWILPPVYTDRLNDTLGGAWTPETFNGPTVNPAFTSGSYAGTACMRITGITGFGIVIFFNTREFTPPADAILEFAIKSESAVAAGRMDVSFGGVDAGGMTAASSVVTLPVIGPTWRVLRVPLGPARVPARINSIRFRNTASSVLPAILLDSISFVQP